MNKWLVTPAFCKAELLEECIKNLHKGGLKGITHVIIDGHYPINKAANRTKIQHLCGEYRCVYLDPGKDLGLHKNLNFTIDKLNVGPMDVFMDCDPDDFPEPGCIERMAEIISMDRSIAVVAPTFHVIEQRIREGHLYPYQVGPYTTQCHKTVEMFKVSGFNMQFILSLPKMFDEPNPYYGGIESYLYSHWKPKGLKLVYIDKHCEVPIVEPGDPRFFDPEYREWKTEHLTRYKNSFEQWLQERGGR